MTSRYARVVVAVLSCMFVVLAVGATRMTAEAIKPKPLPLNEYLRREMLKMGVKEYRDPARALKLSLEHAAGSTGTSTDGGGQQCNYCGEYECPWYGSPNQQCPTCYGQGQSWYAGGGMTAVCACDPSGWCIAEIS